MFCENGLYFRLKLATGSKSAQISMKICIVMQKHISSRSKLAFLGEWEIQFRTTVIHEMESRKVLFSLQSIYSNIFNMILYCPAPSEGCQNKAKWSHSYVCLCVWLLIHSETAAQLLLKFFIHTLPIPDGCSEYFWNLNCCLAVVGIFCENALYVIYLFVNA